VIWIIALIVGLLFGSFFNVCIWRIPRGQSINYPPSHCPHCRKPIRFYDNIPLLSYLILRGRCRDCHQPISIRYPLIEGLTALLFVLAYLRFGLEWRILRALVLIGLLVVLAGIDLDHKIIPFRLSVAGVIVGLLTSLLPIFKFTVAKAFWGGIVGAAFVLFAWGLWRFVLARPFRRWGVKQREGMGWGDLPFAAMIGVFIGPKGMGVGLAVAVFAGVITGIIARLAGRFRAGQEVPFGPFLALGGLVGLFWGEEIFAWYLRMVLL
jgi:leader peptidase (prepilin peptidase)/N-methyltransferase